MGKYFFLIAIALLGGHGGMAQNPSWTDPVERGALYPETQFLSGFSSEMLRKSESTDELRQKHLGFAKTQLVESISVSIKSSATLNLENLNSKSLEQFKQASMSFAEAKFTGLKTETWYDEKKKTIYAFAHVRIAELIKACKADLAEKSALLNKKIDAANAYAASGNLEQALTSYYLCFPLIREIENDEAMLVAIGKESMSGQSGNYELTVNQAIGNLRKERILSMDDVCLLMADGIRQQVAGASMEGGVQLETFTYQDTRTGSEFSSRLSACLEQKMVRQGFNIKSPASRKNEASNTDTSGYVFSGTYWEEGENIKIIGNLRNIKSGRTIAGVEEFLPKKWCSDHGIKFLADNFNQAVTRQKQFAENEITNGGLMAELWTNRGKENPMFARGDTMRIYIKVSQPCYIRLIYYFSDGTKTLLLDSRYIGEDKTDQAILLPDLFVCDAPFGSETIQMVAQSGPFKPLMVKTENGYQVIVDDVGSILANVRGMKSVGKISFIAEKRLEITTLPEN